MPETWWQSQFNLGNIITILSLAVSIGWQVRRMTEMEKELLDIRGRLQKDAEYIAATYERKDVLFVVLQSINLQLASIREALAKAEKHP